MSCKNKDALFLWNWFSKISEVINKVNPTECSSLFLMRTLLIAQVCPADWQFATSLGSRWYIVLEPVRCLAEEQNILQRSWSSLKNAFHFLHLIGQQNLIGWRTQKDNGFTCERLYLHENKTRRKNKEVLSRNILLKKLYLTFYLTAIGQCAKSNWNNDYSYFKGVCTWPPPEQEVYPLSCFLNLQKNIIETHRHPNSSNAINMKCMETIRDNSHDQIGV